VVKTLEAQGGQFLLGCKCPASRGIVVQEQDRLGEFPRHLILRVDRLALWKIIIEEDAVLIPKKIEARTFPSDFCIRNFLGWGEPLCRHSFDCCFVSGS